MIDIKILKKEKTSSSASGISTSAKYYGSDYAKESGHADKADLATEAEHASTADTADLATEANHAKLAYDLDTDSPIFSKFISKINDDTAAGIITFAKGLISTLVSVFKKGATFGEFVTGSSGASIDADGNAEVGTLRARGKATINAIESTDYTSDTTYGAGFCLEKDNDGNSIATIDKLNVRKKASFNELDIKKKEYSAGNKTQGNAGSKLCQVTNVLDSASAIIGYKCYFILDDGTTKTTNDWHLGDMAKCQSFNIETGAHTGVSNKYYWRTVTEVGEETINNVKLGYVILSNQDSITVSSVSCFGFESISDAPAAGDEIVQEGSVTDTDRQSIIVSEVNGGLKIAMYTGIGSDCSTQAKQFSYPNNPFLVSPSDVSITASRILIKTSEGIKAVSAVMGDWSAKAYNYGEQVTHNGSLWMCTSTSGSKSTDEPVDGSSVWTKIVSKGDAGESQTTLAVSLEPVQIILTENSDKTFTITNAHTTIKAIEGKTDVSSGITITGVTSSSAAMAFNYAGQVVSVASISTNPDTDVTATISYTYNGNSYTAHLHVYLNLLGTFKQTIENDISTAEAASKTYTDSAKEELNSTITQKSNSISMQVSNLTQSRNLWQNGEFGDGTNLYSQNSVSSQGAWEVLTASAPLSFAKYLHVPCTTANDGIYSMLENQGITLQASTSYTISMFIKCSAAQNVNIGFESVSGYENKYASVSTSWSRVSITITTGSSAIASGAVHVYCCAVCDMYITGIMLEKGDSMSVYNTYHNELLKAGINIADGTISMLANNFSLTNNSGQKTMGVDKYGNASMLGTVTAANIYQTFCDVGNLDNMTWQGILLDSAGKEIAFNFPPAMMFCKPRVNPNATSTGATGDIINKIVLPFPKDCVNLQTIPAFIGDTTDTSVNQLGQVVDVYCRCGNSYQYRNSYIELVCYDAVYPTSEANRTMSDGTSAILFGSAYQPDEGYGIRLYPYYDDGTTCQAHVRLMAVYFQNSAKYRWVVLEANNAIIMAV